jgi:hypothetical protein
VGASPKRLRITDDVYDYSDPFVDDSELVESVDHDIIARLTQTRTKGFFASSGALEVTDCNFFEY